MQVEERAVTQLRVLLLESGIVKRRWWVIGGFFFCARNIVCNLVLNGTDPLGIHAKGQVYQEQEKELGKQLACAGFLACCGSPTQGRWVVDYVEEDWMRIICDGCSEDDMEQSTIIDDYSDEFKDIDRDETLISIKC
jgi:hypothetical protein